MLQYFTPIWMVYHQLKMPLIDHNILQGRSDHPQTLAGAQAHSI